MPGVGPSSTIIPAKRSFAQLQRFVADYVQAPDDAEALDTAGYGINSGIDHLNTYTWYKGLAYQDITTVLADADYDLDGEVKDPRTTELLNSSSNVQGTLDYLPIKSFLDERYIVTGSGEPCLYTLDYVNRLLLLDVPPTQAWVTLYPTIRFWYFPRFAKLIDADDTFTGPPEFETFLGWYGRAELASVRRPSAAGFAENKWQTILRRLRADDSNTQTDYPK